MTPRVTYRVQLHAGFGFDAAADVVPYLADLGVSHLYCSPYLQAAPGSSHGYDVVDPRHLNVELGGARGHARLVGVLRDAGLGQVLDIVPNHMAVDPTNPWWWDVLAHGPSSEYASYFDIDWDGDDDRSAATVLVPILGDHYGRVLEAGELRVARDGGDFVVRYHDHVLPLSPRTLDDVLSAAARRSGSAALGAVAAGLATIPHTTRTDALVAQLAAVCDTEPSVRDAVDAELAALDADRLDVLLRRQHFRLAHWRIASEELDYRRFFDIDTLIGVRVEDPEVFDATHGLILDLVRDRTVDGLRIDHVDGLRDPAAYLHRLATAANRCWTVVEKILAPGESLPDGWPVAGTSGYDFLVRANDLFVERRNEAAMTDCYRELTGAPADFDAVVRAAKRRILTEELAADVDRLSSLLAGICDTARRHRDHTRRELRDALREVVAAFPVYRTYVTATEPAGTDDRRHIDTAVRLAAERRPELDRELLTFLGALAAGDVEGAAAREFAVRLQQLTAPVTAKGVEDTAFYRYHRLISLNEVGGDPGVFGRPVAEFHRATAAVADRWPETMLTLSTHDTKRSADVRARLDVLSELPVAWASAASRWFERNGHHRRDGWPDPNAEYLLYQTLVGAWPIDADRLVAFMAKATREAKEHTSWTDPDETYEGAVDTFARGILADAAFVADVERFLAEHSIVSRGRRSSLAQTALLLTCPGVPDLYQGSELWDLSLVDPDNRRPVDYGVRRDALAGLPGPPGALDADAIGVEKLRLVQRVLHHRRDHPGAYAHAPYEPIEGGDDVVAFSRGDVVTVVPCRTAGPPAGHVDLPPGRWADLVTGARVDGGRAAVSALLAGFPVAVLARDVA